MVDDTPPSARTGEASTSPVAAVELKGITKRFGEVVACDRVDLSVSRGEIHGLLGQNGAGKSTLMKVLLGLLTPDACTILINGRPVVVTDPLAAADMGIAMVHQHFSVIARSEEPRVGKACVSTCRSCLSPYTITKTHIFSPLLPSL